VGLKTYQNLFGLIDEDFHKQLTFNSKKKKNALVAVFKNPLIATVLQVLMSRTI